MELFARPKKYLYSTSTVRILLYLRHRSHSSYDQIRFTCIRYSMFGAAAKNEPLTSPAWSTNTLLLGEFHIAEQQLKDWWQCHAASHPPPRPETQHRGDAESRGWLSESHGYWSPWLWLSQIRTEENYISSSQGPKHKNLRAKFPLRYKRNKQDKNTRPSGSGRKTTREWTGGTESHHNKLTAFWSPTGSNNPKNELSKGSIFMFEKHADEVKLFKGNVERPHLKSKES